MDLRERVVAACDARDNTREQIAARFSVSQSWVRKVLRQRREAGSIARNLTVKGRPSIAGPAPSRPQRVCRSHHVLRLTSRS